MFNHMYILTFCLFLCIGLLALKWILLGVGSVLSTKFRMLDWFLTPLLFISCIFLFRFTDLQKSKSIHQIQTQMSCMSCTYICIKFKSKLALQAKKHSCENWVRDVRIADINELDSKSIHQAKTPNPKIMYELYQVSSFKASKHKQAKKHRWEPSCQNWGRDVSIRDSHSQSKRG